MGKNLFIFIFFLFFFLFFYFFFFAFHRSTAPIQIKSVMTLTNSNMCIERMIVFF